MNRKFEFFEIVPRIGTEVKRHRYVHLELAKIVSFKEDEDFLICKWFHRTVNADAHRFIIEMR